MDRGDLIEGALTESIIGAFFEVYKELDFGFLERRYVRAMDIELCLRRHVVQTEYNTNVFYKGQDIGKQRLDMVVDGKVIVEVNPLSNFIR